MLRYGDDVSLDRHSVTPRHDAAQPHPQVAGGSGAGSAQPLGRVLVITPWYPTPTRPYDGVFVAESCAALRTQGVETEVIHLINTATQDLPAAEPGVHRVPFEAPAGTSRAEMARRQQAALAEIADLLTEATVVHVHVGIPTGAAVAAILPEHVQLVVTEHATYLTTELTYVAGRRLYDGVLSRAHRVLMVSDVEARRLRARFPQHRDRIRALGNPVRAVTQQTPARPRRDRWLYVGNLIARKGVLQLVEAFAAWHAGHPDARLSLAGTGDLEQELRRVAIDRGVIDRIEFLGPVRPADLGPVFDEADVLVHLSELETFGMTVAEAAMVGLPVVVARSGGPEEVLARAAESGTVRMVSTRPAPAEVLTAVHASTEIDGPDASRARAELARSFGPEAIGRRLATELSGLETPSRGRPLMLVASSPAGHDRLADLAAFALRQDIRVIAVVTDPVAAAALDTRVDVVVLGRHLALLPHHVLDTLVLDRLPGVLLDGGASLLAGESRWRGRASRTVSRLRARHRKLVDRLRTKVFHPLVYRHLDPRLVLRSGGSALTAAARRHRPELVVLTDPESAAAGELISRFLPESRITTAITLREIEDLRVES